MKKIVIVLVFGLFGAVFAADKALDRAKLELVVEDAREMLADSCRSGSPMHGAAYRYYFGLVYGCGTNLLARKSSTRTTQLQNSYMRQVEKDYEAYTRVEDAYGQAAATGADRVHVGRHVVTNGARKRARRVANAEKLGEEELAKAIRRWESLASQIKKRY